ncbi:diguanylate cyclase [Pokkaliibacter sp. CJK22405]|uniref:GGDEF domain-containing protein n=1 Tax=Pokkaliibacter sp. CJK22405 TaxID=3384615 RepID=UPI00398478C0
MSENHDKEFEEFHWMVNMLQTLDVGLVVIDREQKVSLWNGFMENHSGMKPEVVRGQVLSSIYPDMPHEWLSRQLNMIFNLGNKAFSTWEQRPYIFPFPTYQPITGQADYMYQNATLIPLAGLDGKINHACIMIYDMTDAATNKVALKAANNDLEAISRTDALTRLFNRGHLEKEINRTVQRFKRTNEPHVLVMMDIDHFKKVNDTYGHPAGDEVIRQTSRILRACLRNTDFAGRYGGEEFAVVLVNTDIAGGQFFAERLRKQIEKHSVTVDGEAISYTVSLGVAQLTAEMETSHWIEKADSALYESKHAGRNRVTTA